MKCSNCSAELQDGVMFCRECGTKVAPRQERFCRECGAELQEGVKFCSSCGAKVSEFNEINNSATSNTTKVTLVSSEPQYDAGKAKPSYTAFPINKKHLSESADKKTKDLKKILIALTVVFICFLLFTYLGKSGKKNDPQASTNSSAIETVAPTNYSIEKGTSYAFMSDEWNVYIATAVSDSIIKIENWDKTMSSTKKMSFNEDIGSYKINDAENDFYWIDDEHTAFAFSFKDINNSRVKKLESHIFTINISDDDVCKGTNYDKKIACYSYTNDDWHMYRAIPLTDTLIKIECWYRSSSFAWDNYLFGWDWCVIDIDNTDTDFTWTDDEHTSFTITTKDPNNGSYWKKDTFVVFELENPDFKYASVRDFLDGNEFGSMKEPETEVETATEASTTEEATTEALKTTEVTTKATTEAPTTPAVETLSYSSNTKDTVKNGNAGVYAYKSRGGTYDNYYIIDFDEGYVYFFSEGNGEESCDRLKIDSGDLNDKVIITYHDGSYVWSYGLHFKWANQPDHLILQDQNGFEYDFYTTNLKDALAIREKKSMHDY